MSCSARSAPESWPTVFRFVWLSGATNIGAITAALAQRDKLVHVVALSHLPGVQGEQMRQLLQRNLPIALNFDPFVLQLLPILAFVLVAVGLFFKVAAAPFHQWARMFTKARQRRLPLMSAWLRNGEFCFASEAFPLRLFSSQKVSQEQWITHRGRGRGVAYLGQPRRADADQREAPPGVFLDLARGLHPARPRCRETGPL